MKREFWTNRLNLVLSLVTGSIGTTVLWTLPATLLQNGKSTFLYNYIFFMLVIAMPISILELCAGRHSQKNALCTFMNYGKHTLTKYTGIIFIITIPLFALLANITGLLSTYLALSICNLIVHSDLESLWESIGQSGSHIICSASFAMILSGYVLYSGIKQGLERWNKVLFTTILFMFLSLFVVTMFLQEFKQSLNLLFSIHFMHWSLSSSLSALSLAILSLRLGTTLSVTYGSYMTNKDDIPKTALYFTTTMIATAIIVVLTLTTLSLHLEIEWMDNLYFIFVYLIKALRYFSTSYIITALLFFTFWLSMVASMIAINEVAVSNLIEMLSISRLKAIFFVGTIAITAFFLPIFFLPIKLGTNLINETSAVIFSYAIPIATIISTVLIGWRTNKAVLYQEFMQNSSLKNWKTIWLILVRFVSPVIILALIIHQFTINH